MNPVDTLRLVRERQAELRRAAQLDALVREQRRQRTNASFAALDERWGEHLLARGSTLRSIER